MHGKCGVGAALGETENRVASDFVHETNAATAHDAALVIEADARSNIDIFWFFHLQIDEARRSTAETYGKLLQTAFTSLVTDRAVERVIDKKELHHSFAAFFYNLTRGADAHVFGNGIGASDDRTWHPADDFVAIFVASRLLTGCGTWWHAHLHKTHAAISGCGKFRVVAIMWNLDFHRAAGLDHAGAAWELVPNSVDLHIDQAFLGSEVFW